MKRFVISAWICLALYGFGGDLTINGSTTMHLLVQQTAQQFEKDTGIKVDVVPTSSGKGIAFAIEGKGLGMSSRSLKPEEQEKGVQGNRIALDGIMLVVSPKNSISNLSTSQLKDLFSGKSKDWSALGGEAGEIHIYGPGKKHGTYSALASDLGISDLDAHATLYDDQKEIMEAIVNDPLGIGWISVGTFDTYVTMTRKYNLDALSVDGLAPSPANIRSDNYPLCRPLLLVSQEKLSKEQQMFLNFCLGPKGQKLVKKFGFVTLENVN